MKLQDPFHYKQFKKTNPKRLWFTLKARWLEYSSKRRFVKCAIPWRTPDSAQLPVPDYPGADTAVTTTQMQAILQALHATEHLQGNVVEVGVYRGVTTAILATNTQRSYIAVDPYTGYGGSEKDLEQMKQRVGSLPNVTHLRMTSGSAVHQLGGAGVSFVFIDAVHDYVNAYFDGFVWGTRLSPGGMVAFHDTDSMSFAGVQCAVWDLLSDTSLGFELYSHVEGTVILRKAL
jgi:Methyltransferase domain